MPAWFSNPILCVHTGAMSWSVGPPAVLSFGLVMLFRQQWSAAASVLTFLALPYTPLWGLLPWSRIHHWMMMHCPSSFFEDLLSRGPATPSKLRRGGATPNPIRIQPSWRVLPRVQWQPRGVAPWPRGEGGVIPSRRTPLPRARVSALGSCSRQHPVGLESQRS